MQPSTGHAHVQLGLFMLRFHFRLRHFVNLQSSVFCATWHDCAPTSVVVASFLVRWSPVSPGQGLCTPAGDCDCDAIVAQPGQQCASASPKHTSSPPMP